MKVWKAYRLAPLRAATAVCAFALLAPGIASAACSGENIGGSGSSLQAAAQQQIWSVEFDKKCESEPPEQKELVSYESTSSGAGLASWWVGHNLEKYRGFGVSNAFVGTDQPPNETQESEIDEKGDGGRILSIPTLQAAVALPIHLPEGCTALAGKKRKQVKRLALSDAQLQGVFAHTIKTWKQLIEGTNDYDDDKLVGEQCKSETPITRVVRREGSGTTAILMKFLFEIDKGEVDGKEAWVQLAEKDENVSWPAESEALVRAEKGSGIATKVAESPGSIGYANLNEVRASMHFDPEGGGGEGTALFWAELQSKKREFEDPASNGDVAAAANANCLGEAYVGLYGGGTGNHSAPPPSVAVPMNEVTAGTIQKASYPLCGLSYDLSLTGFSKFSEEAHPTTVREVETVKAYFEYILGPGQKELEGRDFLGVPEGKKSGNFLKIAREGAQEIAF
jgi:ABC-type phosphate transport system substrate-binding protein